jgi:hypothetical protein
VSNTLIVGSTLSASLLAEMLTDEITAVDMTSGVPTSAQWAAVDVLVVTLNSQTAPIALAVLTTARDTYPKVRRVVWSGASNPLLVQATALADVTVNKTGFVQVLAAAKQGRKP